MWIKSESKWTGGIYTVAVKKVALETFSLNLNKPHILLDFEM